MTPDKDIDFKIQFTSTDDSITPDELKHILDFIPEILLEMNRQPLTKKQE